jgi:hypothetical protein
MPHIADPLSAAAASSPATSWADFTINTVGFSFRNGQGSPGTIKMIAVEIARQAKIQAFNDLFWFIDWVTFATLPLVLIMKRPERKGLVVA